MGKLELKYLTPYLPYKLKVLTDEGPIILLGYQVIGGKIIPQLNIDELEDLGFDDPIKLILRSLEDFGEEYISKLAKYTNELEPNISIQEATYLILSRIHNPINIPYVVLQKLFEWHFDIFGLIEKGLAIDINTI